MNANGLHKGRTWNRALTAALLLAATAGAAHADGWYAGGFVAPVAEAEDIDFGTALGTVTTTFDGGDLGWGAVVGYEAGSWRIEGEWSAREFDVDDHILGGAALPGPTGTLEAQSLFVNALYDFNRDGTVSPYLGAGAGWTDADLDGFGVAPVPQVLDDGDSGFSYQAIAGVGFNLGESVTIFADYRFLWAPGLEVTVTPGAGAVTSDIDVEAQSLQAGVRFRF